jgi:AcrR family transcriptional regulator
VSSHSYTGPTMNDTAVRRRAAALPPDERRAVIVRATRALLVEHGEMVTTRQIADAVGIAEGTIFRAFADKDALIDAVVDEALDPGPLDRALAEIDPGLDFEVALGRMVELLQQRTIELWRLTASVGMRFAERPRRSQPVSEPMVAYLRAHKAHLAIAPAEAAQLLRGLTIGLTHPSLIEAPLTPPRVVELFLHGAGAH